jgi:ATP-dependent Lon protease
MRDFRDAKVMAHTLRDALKVKSISLTHSESLELIARIFGLHDWNVMAAIIQSSRPPAGPPTATTSASQPIEPGIPIVPLRDVVFSPQMITPIFAAREKTMLAIARALETDGRLLAVTQRGMADDDPGIDDIYTVGVSAEIIHRQTMPNGNLKLTVSCQNRVSIVRPVNGKFLAAVVAPIDDVRGTDAEAFKLSGAIIEAYQAYTNASLPQTLYRYSAEPGLLGDLVARLIMDDVGQMQRLLETNDVVVRLEMVLDWLKAAAASRI